MNYLFLITGLVSLGALGLLHKYADFLQCRPAAVNLFLFAWPAIISAALLVLEATISRQVSFPPVVLGVGLICGAVGSIAILALQNALHYGQISTSWLIINLSTAIPTALSIVIYKEQVGTRQKLSLVLVALSLALLWWDRRSTDAAVQHEEKAEVV
jgi:drug/metabolite transporter (DMT)-like permease